MEEKLKFNSGGHTGRDVPIYAYGMGAEVFDGKTIENVQIPKTIVSLWGESLAADTDDTYPVLK
jgi:alkaline phosphatase